MKNEWITTFMYEIKQITISHNLNKIQYRFIGLLLNALFIVK